MPDLSRSLTVGLLDLTSAYHLHAVRETLRNPLAQPIARAVSTEMLEGLDLLIVGVFNLSGRRKKA